MTSQAGARVSPPTWGALRDRPAAERPAADRRAGGVDRPARRARAPLELRGPSAFPSELVAGAVLLALWIVLWALFTAGVVEPASALARTRGAEGGRSPGSGSALVDGTNASPRPR
jgi:hypothetical protein